MCSKLKTCICALPAKMDTHFKTLQQRYEHNCNHFVCESMSLKPNDLIFVQKFLLATTISNETSYFATDACDKLMSQKLRQHYIFSYSCKLSSLRDGCSKYNLDRLRHTRPLCKSRKTCPFCVTPKTINTKLPGQKKWQVIAALKIDNRKSAIS